LRIAICDDDAHCREEILCMVNEYIAASGRRFTVTVYERADTLLDDVLRFGGFDIYILDIIMPGVNGIQLGVELRKHDYIGKILYLTSSREYAIDAFRAKASDYLLKPVEKDDLFAALDDAIQTIANRREKSFIVKSRERNVKLGLDSILYIDLHNKTIIYHLVDGSAVESTSIRTTFSDVIAELLSDSRFVLCGNSVAVNLYYVTMTETDTLFFRNGSKLYIGKRAGREIRSAWSDFWMSGEGRK